MAQWMDRSTLGFTHMGGEGANWVGEAPFSTRGHVFQNLGDGTYNHSGMLAIRARGRADVNITYKILFNDAVAMTGGQPHEGGLDRRTDRPAGGGRRRRKRIVLVTDEPDKYAASTEWPRRRDHPSPRRPRRRPARACAPSRASRVLIYDQTCAAEKRRRRKRGTFPDPRQARLHQRPGLRGLRRLRRASRTASRCSRSRPNSAASARIDQSSCNKDFSCVNGFCPSFVTVHGAKLKKGESVAEPADWPALPEPSMPLIDQPYGIIVTGVGGTGVVTVGAILGMAAHLEGKGVGIIDMAGLAQKGGAVYSHIRIANTPDDIHAIRVAAGGADLVLGGDIVVAGNKKVLGARSSRATPRSSSTPPSSCPAISPATPTSRCRPSGSSARSPARPAREHSHFVDARRLATALLGNSHRRQHVHARLRLSARRAAAVGARRSRRRSS